jgi:hypothetical protein
MSRRLSKETTETLGVIKQGQADVDEHEHVDEHEKKNG